jgi:hypothetical protein
LSDLQGNEMDDRVKRNLMIALAALGGVALVWLGLQNPGRSYLLGTNNPETKSEPLRLCDPAIEKAVGESLQFSVLTTAMDQTEDGWRVVRGFSTSEGPREALCVIQSGEVTVQLDPRKQADAAPAAPGAPDPGAAPPPTQ